MKKNMNFKIILIILCVLLISMAFIGMYIKNKSTLKIEDQEIDVSNVKLDKSFFSSLSEKELIHYKIMNSIDLFDTVEGEYESTNESIKEDEKVTYSIDAKNNKSYHRIIDKNYDKDSVLIINNGKKYEFDNKEKTYREFTFNLVPKDKTIKLLRPKDRYSKKKGYIRREDGEFLTGISQSLFNQDYLVTYLEDYNNWNIIGYDKYLNRDCIKIAGKLGFIGKDGVSKYNTFIDKGTGIMLKFQLLNNKDEIKSSVITKNIKINEPINTKVFEIVTTGYTKVDKIITDKK